MPDPEKRLELFTYALSPFGMKVYWALIFKRAQFKLVYVHPRDQREIAFSQQKVVPMLRYGEEWRQDSLPICQWLERLFPEPPFAGSDEQEIRAIEQTDRWVTHNLIALRFRRLIDRETRSDARRDGRIYCDVLQATSGGVMMAWLARNFWPELLSGAGFIQRAARMTDMSTPVRQLEDQMADVFEDMIAATGFLAKTARVSFADIAAYAQVAAQIRLKLSGGLQVDGRPKIQAWFERVSDTLPIDPDPPVIAHSRFAPGTDEVFKAASPKGN